MDGLPVLNVMRIFEDLEKLFEHQMIHLKEEEKK